MQIVSLERCMVYAYGVGSGTAVTFRPG